MGKTVLLGEFERIAVNAGWIVAKLEVRKSHPLTAELASKLAISLRGTTHRFAVDDTTAGSV